MLTPRRLAIARTGESGPGLQAALEALVGRLLEGRIQSGLVTARWGENSVLLGYYEPYLGGGDLVRRRITGGYRVRLASDEGYTGFVFAAESLREAVELAEKIAKCLGSRAWGATRIGPSQLGAGVVEAAGHSDPDRAVHCIEEALGAKLEKSEIDVSSSIRRIRPAYENEAWAKYRGAEPLPTKARINRCNYWVRIGLALAENTYIAEARIDGVFNAAPPNEPFNILSNLRGMPVGEQAELSLEVRLARLELHGVKPSDILEAFKAAARSARGEG